MSLVASRQSSRLFSKAALRPVGVVGATFPSGYLADNAGELSVFTNDSQTKGKSLRCLNINIQCIKLGWIFIKIRPESKALP